MILDPLVNFGKATVSAGYDSAATSVVLTTGHGAKLPTEHYYNLVWWNSTDYADPADDPSVEIVRVTNRSTDTLTIVRAQEGTSAANHNTGGKTYKMALCMTKKAFEDLALPPGTYAHLYDSFFGGHTTSSGAVGGLGWQGAGSWAYQAGVAGHSGILRSTTTSTINNIAYTRLAGGFLPADNFRIFWEVKLGQADTTVYYQVGCGFAGAVPPTDGIYFEKAGADTNWFAVCRSASVETRTDTGVAVDTTSWFALEIWRKNATTIAFSINGGADIDITTNIPTAAMEPFAQTKTLASAAKYIEMDTFEFVAF